MSGISKRNCSTCKHWHRKDKDSKWGKCDVALNGPLFKNHTSWCPEGYMARHTNSRYYNNPACKTRYEEGGDADHVNYIIRTSEENNGSDQTI